MKFGQVIQDVCKCQKTILAITLSKYYRQECFIICDRRGDKVTQNIPSEFLMQVTLHYTVGGLFLKKLKFNFLLVYRDIATPTPFIEPFLQDNETAKPDHIFLDSIGFGTAACLQVYKVTFQCK